MTLAAIGRAGCLDPFGSTEAVPEDQLFFLGGTSSVRGYNENMLGFDVAGKPVGGCSAFAGALEIMIDLGYDYELTGFYDAGRLNKTLNATGSDFALRAAPDKTTRQVESALRKTTVASRKKI